MLLNFITWNIDPILAHLGPLTIRWYGLLWALGIYATLLITQKIFKNEKLPEAWVDKLFIYTVVGTIIGARLGHCLFYEWDYFSAHPLEILYIWHGGLASHGGAIGILIAVYIFDKKVSKKGFIWVMDRLVIGVAICGAAIRLGNLMNSEIYGGITSMPWGFQFVRDSKIAGDLQLISGILAHSGLIKADLIQHLQSFITNFSLAGNLNFGALEDALVNAKFISYGQTGELLRLFESNHLIAITQNHPTQIYEILYCLITFVAVWWLYWKKEAFKKTGLIFGVFLIGIFASRFLLEFIKLDQEAFEAGMILNMGQILSIPFIVWGIWLLYKSKKKSVEE